MIFINVSMWSHSRYWKEKNMVKIDINNDYNMYYTTARVKSVAK